VDEVDFEVDNSEDEVDFEDFEVARLLQEQYDKEGAEIDQQKQKARDFWSGLCIFFFSFPFFIFQDFKKKKSIFFFFFFFF